MKDLNAIIQQAIAHHQAGRLQEAERLYRAVLEQSPNQPDALHLLGVLAAQVGQFPVAIDLIGRAIQANPRMAAAHNNLGNALRDSKRLDEAEASFRRALQLDPNFADAHANVANILRDRGRLNEAVASYRKALSLVPNHLAAVNNLGNALRDLGKLDEAADAYRKAIALNPNSADAHYNLGNLLRQLHQLVEAAASLQRALQLRPNYVEALVGLGATYQDAGRIDEAVATNQAALKIDPNSVEANTNLAIALKDRGEIHEAIPCLDRAVALAPNESVIAGNRLYSMHFDPGCDPPTILAAHREWDRRHVQPLASKIRPHTNDRSPERRLRIGYVSGDFCNHPIGRFLLQLFEHHDHGPFEIRCYSHMVARDAVTQRLQKCADAWYEITYDSDDAVAQKIRADGIDILVDLSLHTAANRLLLFARKPAPVQVSWLGYPGTSGVSTIDYRLTDPNLEPPGDDTRGVEKPYRLPDCFWCYDASSQQGTVSAPPLQSNGYVTFGCLNAASKMNGMILALWARILRGVEHSRLLLLAPPGEFRKRVLAIMAEQGVSADRIEFLGRMSIADYLLAFNRIDISLDPYPYNGHTTNFDSTWMGVPIVTLSGQTPASRAGLTVLANLGLTEQAAYDPDAYVKLAVELANNSARQAELRRTLRERMTRSPLMDGKRFARNIEAAYRQMWRKYCG